MYEGEEWSKTTDANPDYEDTWVDVPLTPWHIPNSWPMTKDNRRQPRLRRLRFLIHVYSEQQLTKDPRQLKPADVSVYLIDMYILSISDLLGESSKWCFVRSLEASCPNTLLHHIRGHMKSFLNWFNLFVFHFAHILATYSNSCALHNGGGHFWNKQSQGPGMVNIWT